MTIEQKINNYIDEMNEYIDATRDGIIDDVIDMTWEDVPISMFHIQYWDEVNTNTYKFSANNFIVEKINKMIDEADETECLTSGVEYIRKMKKKMMRE